jgi:tetratricopeptide (TPR) repeat protein
MTAARRHLLGQAALCYEQAGQPAEAARCRVEAGELVAAAELFRVAGELTKAADCYRRAGRTGDAASCLLALGRPEDAAKLWEQAGDPLEAAWMLVLGALKPQRARRLLTGVTAAGRGENLRLRITTALCAALEGRPDPIAAALGQVEEDLASVTPASEQDKLARWAIQAADQVGRPDLAAQVFAAAYRCRLRGTVSRWRDWARTALGGTAGIPERDL